MKLKDLVMQVTYDEIEPAIGAAFISYGLEVNAWRKENWRKVFATLQSIEPEQDCDMSLRVAPGDVSGFYDEEARQKNPEYTSHIYSLTATPWRNWLGMEVDEETLKNMPVADILGNCIYEMTWWGYDEETIRKNIEERFKQHEEEKEGNDTETEADMEQLEVDGPKAIDLGLPSGTMWASCNIGATKPEENGIPFAWGETHIKEIFDDKTYLHSMGKDTDDDGFYDEDVVFKDLGDINGTDYDVAHKAWGGDWQMPTWEQIKELLDNCNYRKRTLHGVMGFQFVGPNGNSIFLPAAGMSTVIYDESSIGYYWSGSQSQSERGAAYGLSFDMHNGDISWESFNRSMGFPVRPVTRSAKFVLSDNTIELEIGDEEIIWIYSGNGAYSINTVAPERASAKIEDDVVVIIGKEEGFTTVSVTDEESGQTATVMVHVFANKTTAIYEESGGCLEAVDLGLPSGTRWANMNLGATRPEGSGGYYAWGEVEEKDVYNDVTYKYFTGNDTNDDGLYEKYMIQDLGDICGTEYDAAHVKWGDDWQMPTIDQFKELVNYCSDEWVSLNGVNGRKFTGPNGRSIFLPAAGHRWESRYQNPSDKIGYYWSGTQTPNNDSFAYYFDFDDLPPCSYNGHQRSIGCSIRPVAAQKE